MTTTRGSMGTRRRIVFGIEGKAFEAILDTADIGREVTLVEKVNGKTFTGRISMNGGKWVSKLLCQISTEETQVGTSFRWPEIWGSITGTIMANEWGKFLKINIFRRDGGRRFSTLCFPSGDRRSGWEKFGAGVRSMLEIPHESLRSNKGSHQDRIFNFGRTPTFAQICNPVATGARNTTIPCEVNIRNGGSVTNASWWKVVVLCTVEGFDPDWKWLENKVKGVFPQATFKYPQKDEALISLSSEEEVSRLMDLPPLKSWEGTYRMNKWGPNSGSLVDRLKAFRRKETTISLRGIPYHLRIPSVVKDLAYLCGSDVYVMEETLRSDRQNCCFSVKIEDFAKIPRIITLEERGYKHPVFVEVDMSPIYDVLPDKTAAPTIQNLPVVNREEDSPQLRVGQGRTERGESSMGQSYPPGWGNQYEQGLIQVSEEVNFIKEIPNEGPVLRIEGPAVDINNRFSSLGDSVERAEIANDEIPISHVPMIQAQQTINVTRSLDIPREDGPILPLQQEGRGRRRKPRNYGHRARSIGPAIFPNKHFWRMGLNRHQNGQRDSASNQAQGETSQPTLSLESRSRVSESPLQVEETRASLQPQIESTIFSVEEIAKSLVECKTPADIGHWIKYMCVPFSHEMGMTSNLGDYGEERLFREIYAQRERVKEKETTTGDCGEREVADPTEPQKELTVSHVV
ncbi:hypothetical protein FRX31_021293 [Thalictrum thalictroides]|uniref:DUF4283 domain-containing protein n=1 Tax=Thalictrum thalictroides TaxID=46969 RepID=A0A7J6VY62_THATH|nr:hypothetical protein FRX31_021293 [Thalictrum thalictroides]